ncbi:hypothetical protein MKZ38_009413 [Zalerion maritima]|uniref:WSC domain-containing protein n=1 Tax=Zalerion maritima TaxID=339359 RepID=A0AAD5WUQ6_9PEZI|nr:hypothetical protein MKZ38_009413 [Zalerion maritima]
MAALPLRAFHFSIVLGVSALLWVGQSSAAFTAEYCSDINTASSSANYSTFQSNGLCDTYCDGYSYAILQDSACWCSDFTPASSTNVDLDDCDTECPGYPDDSCGKAGEYYIYLFKNQSPSGTKSASSTSSSSTSATKSTETETLQKTTTVQNTVTITPSTSFSSTSTATSSRKSGSSTTTSSSSSSRSSSSDTVSTITTSGIVQTVTVAPDGSVRDSSDGGGLSSGAAAGVAAGVIVAVLGISGGLFFLWWKKRRDRQEACSADPSPRSSSAGMVSTMASMTEAGQSGTKRGSKFIPIDDRMEFHHGIYARGEHPVSRDSVDSLRDDMDYSRRVLRTTNPDPPPQ